MTAVGYPKLSYSRTGDHSYAGRVQAAPGAAEELIGHVRRSGSLPSMQQWRGRGVWPGAIWTRPWQQRNDEDG